MAARHRSRERALQLLYSIDVRKQPAADAIGQFYDSLSIDEDEAQPRPRRDKFMETLVAGAAERTAGIDTLIAKHSEHWRIERMSAVDRNILRLAVYELQAAETPPAVVIDEALELARRFSGEESIPFINGVLDAVRQALTAGTSE